MRHTDWPCPICLPWRNGIGSDWSARCLIEYIFSVIFRIPHPDVSLIHEVWCFPVGACWWWHRIVPWVLFRVLFGWGCWLVLQEVRCRLPALLVLLLTCSIRPISLDSSLSAIPLFPSHAILSVWPFLVGVPALVLLLFLYRSARDFPSHSSSSRFSTYFRLGGVVLVL